MCVPLCNDTLFIAEVRSTVKITYLFQSSAEVHITVSNAAGKIKVKLRCSRSKLYIKSNERRLVSSLRIFLKHSDFFSR